MKRAAAPNELRNRAHRLFKTALAAKRFMLGLEREIYRAEEISAWRAHSLLLDAASTVSRNIVGTPAATEFLTWFYRWIPELVNRYNEREIRRVLPR